MIFFFFSSLFKPLFGHIKSSILLSDFHQVSEVPLHLKQYHVSHYDILDIL